MLTIAIPTYNRNEILAKNIQLLLPQLNEQCTLLIIDNCSDIPVEQTLQNVLAQFPSVNYRLIRNKANIGCNANIMRCFELCETDWLLVLGDDDEVATNAITLALSEIQKRPDYTFINFHSEDKQHPIRSDITTTIGLYEFIEKIDYFGSILFISASLFNIKKVMPYLHWGNFMQTSCAPHLAMLFLSLQNTGQCCLLPQTIVKCGSGSTPAQLKLSAVYPSLGLPLLLDLPLDTASKKQLTKKICGLFKNKSHILWIINQLAHLTLTDDKKEILYFYKQITKRYFVLDKKITTRLLGFIGFFVIRYSNFFIPILDYLYQIVRKKNYQHSSSFAVRI
jgi:abequosyltransferase